MQETNTVPTRDKCPCPPVAPILVEKCIMSCKVGPQFCKLRNSGKVYFTDFALKYINFLRLSLSYNPKLMRCNSIWAICRYQIGNSFNLWQIPPIKYLLAKTLLTDHICLWLGPGEILLILWCLLIGRDNLISVPKETCLTFSHSSFPFYKFDPVVQ